MRSRSSHRHRIHYSLDGETMFCRVELHMTFKENLRASNNLDLVNCGNCRRYMYAHYSQPSMVVRNGPKEQEKRERQIARNFEHRKK